MHPRSSNVWTPRGVEASILVRLQALPQAMSTRSKLVMRYPIHFLDLFDSAVPLDARLIFQYPILNFGCPALAETLCSRDTKVPSSATL